VARAGRRDGSRFVLVASPSRPGAVALLLRVFVRRHTGTLVPLWVAALTAILALRHLHDPLWQDEVASAWIIDERSLTAVVHRVVRTESTPPLWYLLAWVSHRAGLAVADVRLLSIAALSSAAAITVVLARRLMPLPFAALAGLLVAVGAQFAAHAHELRAYALLTLVTVAFALLLVSEASHATRWCEAGLALTTAAGLLTHYFFVFTVAAALAWLWLDPRGRPIRFRATGAVSIGGALGATFLPSALRQYHAGHLWWIGSFSFTKVAAAPFRIFSALATTGMTGRVIPLLVSVTAIAAAVLVCRTSSYGRLFLLFGLGPLLLAGALWALGVRIFAVRNLIESGPFLAICAANVVARLPRRLHLPAAVAVVLAASGGYAWTQVQPRTPYEQIADALVSEGWQTPNPIAVVGNFFAFRSPLEWYLPRNPSLAHLPTLGTCPRVFLVANDKIRRPPGVLATMRAGDFLIERLQLSAPLRHVPILRSATILADPHDPPSCKPSD